MAMDWDARAMHMHLMCIAWQQDPPCTLPDNDAMLRRWLGNPKKWEALKPQIFMAWVMVDGRWLQKGLSTQFDKQSAYSESRKDAAQSRWKKHAYASANSCITDALQSSTSSAKEQKQKPSRRKAPSDDGMKHSTDPRHIEFKEAIHAYWKFKNGDLQMPWGAMEGAQLGMWLRDAPHITIEQFQGMLKARAKSKVNHGERPAQWIKWITSYGPGPVNEFKNTMEVGNEQGANQNGSGTGKPSPARERVDGARRVLANIAVKRGFVPPVGGDGAVDQALSKPRSGIEHRGVLQGLRAVGGDTHSAESREGDHGAPDQAGPVVLPASR